MLRGRLFQMSSLTAIWYTSAFAYLLLSFCSWGSSNFPQGEAHTMHGSCGEDYSFPSLTGGAGAPVLWWESLGWPGVEPGASVQVGKQASWYQQSMESVLGGQQSRWLCIFWCQGSCGTLSLLRQFQGMGG
jgi:hypothetical protein